MLLRAELFPQIHMLKSSCPGPQNMTVLKIRFLKRSLRKKRSLGWAPIQSVCVPVRRGGQDTDTHRGTTTRSHKWGRAGHKLRWETSERANSAHTPILDSSLQSCETVNIVAPRMGYLVWQPSRLIQMSRPCHINQLRISGVGLGQACFFKAPQGFLTNGGGVERGGIRVAMPVPFGEIPRRKGLSDPTWDWGSPSWSLPVGPLWTKFSCQVAFFTGVFSSVRSVIIYIMKTGERD